MSIKRKNGFTPAPHRGAGFTLLEVLIAAGILIIVTGAAAGTAVMALNTGVFSKDRTIAQEQARREMEIIRAHIDTEAMDEESNTEWSVVRYSNWINQRGRTIQIDNKVFTITPEAKGVTDDINAGDNGMGSALDGCDGGKTCYVKEDLNMLKVIVSVSWEEAFLGKDKEVKLVTYMTNNKQP